MADRKAHRVEAGTKLAHYRIEAPIGEGSMGVVYRAHDLGLDRPVALKVLKDDVSEDEEFVARFVREARAAARVGHPNLTHVYFVGEEGGRHFFAMEYVQGRDLESLVEAEGPLPLQQALDVVLQVARGLETAHAAGVVHRDVKPSNLLLEADGTVRVTDFGLAKSLDADVSSTRAGQVLGTPRFMSPEQCLGGEVDARTDVYALGLTLFTLLAGRPPYETKHVGQLLNDHLRTPLPPIAATRPDLPAGLDAELARMCAKDPGERPRDMAEVRTRLDRFRARRIQRAPLTARALAAFLDAVAITAVLSLVSVIAELVFGRVDFEGSLVGGLVYVSLFTAYHLVTEARWQKTLGKWLFQLHVVSSAGAPPPARVLLPRFLLRYPWVPLSPLGLLSLGRVLELGLAGVQVLAVALGIASYVTSRGLSLSDRLTRTRVAIRMSDTLDA